MQGEKSSGKKPKAIDYLLSYLKTETKDNCSDMQKQADKMMPDAVEPKRLQSSMWDSQVRGCQ